MAALLTRDPDKRSFLVFLAVIAFIGSASLMDLVAKLPAFIDPAPSTLLLLTVLGVCAAVSTVRSRYSFAPASRFLGLTSALLVTFNLAHLGSADLGQTTAAHAVIPPTSEAPAVSSVDRPSIYLIVPDKYQGSASLRSYYGFDNTRFEQGLRDRGFILPLRPRANYIYTRQAMNALLNWEYLDSLIALVGDDATDLTPLFNRLEDNRTIAFLKRLGYEIVFFPNDYEPFRENRHADLHVPDPEVIRPALVTAWLASTVLVPLARTACNVAPATCLYVPGVAESPTLTDWKFIQLGRLASSNRPRFVLAHLSVPHEPYVYDADCHYRSPWLVGPDDATTRAAYLNQVRCVNRKLLAAVDVILRTSRTPPVILLQSDHGHGHLPQNNLELEKATPAAVRARVDVFAAYYVSRAPDTLFYEGMTPINLLPRVFNHLFGTTFPQLPDRTYWAVYHSPYRSTPVPPETLAGPD
jgi:hypothetical protein